PAEADGDTPSSLTIMEFKPAGIYGEWGVPVRVGLAGLALGPQGLDEKRVTDLVAKDQELIPSLADYSEQTADIGHTVDTLTPMEDTLDEDEPIEPHLNRADPTNQALSALLRTLNLTLLANNPLGAGKRAGPVTLMNKASVGFFENAGGLFPGGGALGE